VLTQHFEQISLDLISSLPKGKGGVHRDSCMHGHPMARTYSFKICDGQGISRSCSRNFQPYQILTDRGPQFVGVLSKQVSLKLGIEPLQTTAYHLQTNGVLERLHSTLEAMLGKTRSLGLDWVKQIPFVL